MHKTLQELRMLSGVTPNCKVREGVKKKLAKSGQADRLSRPPLPRSGQENVKNSHCHIWGYFAIL